MARTAQTDGTTPPCPTLYVALELSKNTCKLAFTTSRTRKARIRDVKARDLPGFLAEVEAAKGRLGLPEDAPVKSCYEAGRDGFWIHRFLEAHGIENVIVDSASIEVKRRSRRPKETQPFLDHHFEDGAARRLCEKGLDLLFERSRGAPGLLLPLYRAVLQRAGRTKTKIDPLQVEEILERWDMA